MMAQTEAKRSPLTTLCYLEKDGQYLMLHRISKKNDVNKGKWIGVGGHFEEGESPEECMLREVFEETGYTLTFLEIPRDRHFFTGGLRHGIHVPLYCRWFYRNHEGMRRGETEMDS